MAVILYTEERLLAGDLTTQHRSMMSIDFASMLPIYYNYDRATYFSMEKLVYSSPYFPMPQLYQLSMNIPKDIHNQLNKICNNLEFQQRFEFVSAGMLDGLNWENVYFTGSMAEVCYYKNGLYPFEFLMSKNKYNPYLESDIDLGIWISREEEEEEQGEIKYDDELVKQTLKTKAEEIVAVVRKNYGLTQEELPLVAKNSRWTISHPKLPRDIDIFSFVVDPAALIYNYHMATCRVVWQGKDAMVLSSGIFSAMLGTCIDRRWFSSSVSIHNRILKQFKRGIGLVLNPQEMKVIIQYFAKYQEENKGDLDFIESMKRVANSFTHGVDLTLPQNQNKIDRFVHLNLFAEKNSPKFRSGIKGRFYQGLGQFIGYRPLN